jgi:peptidoglycan/xylan/chitin deacetylase (PgdA/CDA1 family)
MWNGKMKALTFSYDDGTLQDRRLVEIFNKYGLKATFNLNSGLFGNRGRLNVEGVLTETNKVFDEEIKGLYDGHEVAGHTLHHPTLNQIGDEDVIRQVEDDRKYLQELVGYNVCGMAYPCGGVDDRVVKLIEDNTGIRYARTTISTYNYELQEDLLRFNPTISHYEFDKMVEMGEEFLRLEPDRPQLYYIWGHSYEFDTYQTWERFEEFCKMMSNHDDIFYGTNYQVLFEK